LDIEQNQTDKNEKDLVNKKVLDKKEEAPDKKEKVVEKRRLVFYIALITVFIGILVYLGIKLGPKITELAKNPEKLHRLLNSFGWKGVLVFIGIQILQVLVAAIPGEIVQIAGGYIYGTWLGTLYSLIGILIGSILVFFIVRLLGYPLVRLVASEAQIEKFNSIFGSAKSEAAAFILFLIPGIPKDILTYIAGVTPVKPLRFFIIIMIGRFPALLASSYIGHGTQMGNYLVVIILCVAAVVLFLVGLLLKDRIIEKIHRFSLRRKM
jgi:uncharacterized membrane protein YdjX (TVP38/TMEM64 family)